MEFNFAKEPGRKLLNRELQHDGKPLVSIITPFYNAGKYFEQTYNCVMNQTFPWFEWIIVDDGSTDEASLGLLNHLQETDPRIRVVHQENRGLSGARNTGFAESTTPIVIPIDADDLITPTYAEQLFWTLHFNPQAGWAYTDTVGFGSQNYLWRKMFSASTMKTDNQLVCTAAIRKTMFEAVGGYKTGEKQFNEDWYFWLKAMAKGFYPVHTGGYLFWYRRTDSGMLSNIKCDPNLKSRNQQLISEAARNVSESITAKEYPINETKVLYQTPEGSTWDRKVYAKHDKIHVLMMLPCMVMGGADRFNLDVCAGLDKNRFEIGIISTIQSENNWQQLFADHVSEIFNLPEFLDIENWAEFISYYIRSRDVDVLFLTNSYYGYYLVPWLRKEFPDLVILDYIHMEEWYWRKGGYARCSGVMGEILEKTLVCNERTRKVMIQDFGRNPESVETLYIGVDAEKYDASKVEAGLARKQFDIREDRPIVLFPCRIHPQKRPFLMLEIAKRLPDLAFVVVGDGPEMDKLKDAIARDHLEDTVYLAGQQADVRPWYRDAALTLICSIKEGLALTAYESLSMGVPVITSDVGGQGELVNDSVGRIVPMLQNEADDLANRVYSDEEIELYVKAIKDILADNTEYEKTRAACRKRILEHFSSRLMVRRLEDTVVYLMQNNDAKYARRETAQALQKLGTYVDDGISSYLRFEAMELETANILSSRDHYRILYEQGITNMRLNDLSDAEKRLNDIYNMRTWILIQRYRHFMDETRIGRGLRKIREILRGH